MEGRDGPYAQGAAGSENDLAMSRRFTESTIECAAIEWLESLGWGIAHEPDISPAGDTPTVPLSQRERESYSQVVLERRLRGALARLNPQVPADALGVAFRNTADENATIWSTFNQLETYKKQIPSLFFFNEVLVISDGVEARSGACGGP